MSPSPIPLFTASQVRELDRLAIEERGVSGILLMKRAGRAIFQTLREIYGGQPLTIYCGAGNNGGDGYIVAALAASAKMPVRVIQLAAPAKLSGAALRAYDMAVSENVPMESFLDAKPPAEGVIVDAMLGTGLNGSVRGDFAAAIDQINSSGLPVVAADIPSGICADTGKVLGGAVVAEVTVTFIGRKRGLYTGRGPAFCGEIFFDALEVPADIYDQMPAAVKLSDWQGLKSRLPVRAADAHKGLSGHVMIIGGDLGFGGAVAMAAEAALRSGAGLVSVATRAAHVAGLNARCPEVMAVAVASGQELEPLLDRPTVLVIGPGLGRTPWSEQLLQKALASGKPMVLDADALNLLSEGRIGQQIDYSRSVITPHPGEAARLLGCTAGDIQDDRFAAVKKLAEKLSATALLKGVGTLVANGRSDIALCPYGNPGMAVGGMGDVLSGVVGALLAQGLEPLAAAEIGACVHSLAGDCAAEESGEIGLTATELLPHIRRLLNEARARNR